MIIPFFIMNRGCPHRCRFCNERLTAGEHPDRIEQETFRETVHVYLAGRRKPQGSVQIAFYGGTFTGMPWEEQSRLLDLTAPFIAAGEIEGIRISTRPDQIDPERIALLKARGVTMVEVGAQSLDDRVLLSSQRGHRAADTVRALRDLKAGGVEAGIHLMAGLPGDSPELFSETIEKVIALRPSTVRIHPTIVLKDTPLAEDFQRGSYRPLTLDEAVIWCRGALKKLALAGIPVIRLGLQTTEALEAPGAVVAGPFHPAFRSLVEASLFREMSVTLLEAEGEKGIAGPGDAFVFSLSPADLSSFQGQGGGNLGVLQGRFADRPIRVTTDPSLPRQTLILTAGSRRLRTCFSGQIEELNG